MKYFLFYVPFISGSIRLNVEKFAFETATNRVSILYWAINSTNTAHTLSFYYPVPKFTPYFSSKPQIGPVSVKGRCCLQNQICFHVIMDAVLASIPHYWSIINYRLNLTLGKQTNTF